MNDRHLLAGWWPRSLRSRLFLILFAGLAIAYGLSFSILFAERYMSAKAVMLGTLEQDLAVSIAIVDRLPAVSGPTGSIVSAAATINSSWPRPSRRFRLVRTRRGNRSEDRRSRRTQVSRQGRVHSRRRQEASGTSDVIRRFAPDDRRDTARRDAPGGMAALCLRCAKWWFLLLLTWLAVRQTTRPSARLLRQRKRSTRARRVCR